MRLFLRWHIGAPKSRILHAFEFHHMAVRPVIILADSAGGQLVCLCVQSHQGLVASICRAGNVKGRPLHCNEESKGQSNKRPKVSGDREACLLYIPIPSSDFFSMWNWSH